MSKPSQEYLSRVEKWILGGLSIQHMNMSLVQKFRARIAYEAYQFWLGDKQIRPTEMMRRIAAREYAIYLEKAARGDKEAQLYIDALNIKHDIPRTPSEISNDVFVFNWIIGRLNVDTTHIERAKVEDASDWLIKEGMSRHDARAVKSGADLKMQLHDKFNEKENAVKKMARGKFLTRVVKLTMKISTFLMKIFSY